MSDNRLVKNILYFQDSVYTSQRKSLLYTILNMIIQCWTAEGSERIHWACSVTIPSFEPSKETANLLSYVFFRVCSWKLYLWLKVTMVMFTVKVLHSTNLCHHEGCKMKAKISKAKGPRRCQLLIWRGKETAKHNYKSWITPPYLGLYVAADLSWNCAHPRVHALICQSYLVLQYPEWCSATQCQFEMKKKAE